MNTANKLGNTEKNYKWRIFKRKKQVLNGCTALGVALSAVVSVGLPVDLYAAPTGGVITSGNGVISSAGNDTNINQSSSQLDINWNTFSTDINESINFFQPDSSSVVINRVIGGIPSQLRGALNANGNVFILNDSGITFYNTSRVNVGALLATTASDITIDGDKYSFTGSGEGSVINNGDITVSNGGWAILAAPYVENTGFMKADLGQIELASTSAFTLDIRGDNLITYTLSDESLSKLGVKNTGGLQARSGQINISTSLASDIVNSVVNLDGVIDADIFGSNGGGTILVTSSGDINNDAIITANGGDVITLADSTNNFNEGASITARNDGFVEISGAIVNLNGKVDTDRLLIDPVDLVIADGSGGSTDGKIYEETIEAISQAGTDVELLAENSITLEDLSDNELEGGAGNIELSAGNSIVFADKNDKISTTTGDIILEIDPSLALAVGTTGGDGFSVDIGSLESTNGGSIFVTSDRSIRTDSLTVGDSAELADNDVDIRVEAGDDIVVGDISVELESLKSDSDAIASAYVKLLANGSVTVDGDVNISTETRSADANDKSLASSKFRVEANDAGSSIEINGNTNVTAVAVAGFDDGGTVVAGDNADAEANVKLLAGGDVSINGNTGITSNASVFSDGGNDNDAEAISRLEVRVAGNISVTGNTNVQATSTTGSDDNENANGDESEAYAKAKFIAGGDIEITGVTTIDADATTRDNNDSADSDDDADAEAILEISAGNDESDGSVEITGDILITADADTDGLAFVDSAEADAFATIEATADVTLNNNLTTIANAYGNAGLNDDGARSRIDVEGNIITSNGDISAVAIHVLDAPDFASDDTASLGGATVLNGNIGGRVFAEASVDIGARNGVNIGDVSANAEATRVAINLTDAYFESQQIQGADANSEILVHTDGGDVVINGDVDVTSFAIGGGVGTTEVDLGSDGAVEIRNGAYAKSEAKISAGQVDNEDSGDVTINGDIIINADAVADGDTYNHNDSSSSGFHIEFGNAGGDADADADATIEAGGDIIIENDIIVNANAEGRDATEFINEYSSSDENYILSTYSNGAEVIAEANIRLVAGDFGGSVEVGGDVVATTSADRDAYADGFESDHGLSYSDAEVDIYASTSDNVGRVYIGGDAVADAYAKGSSAGESSSYHTIADADVEIYTGINSADGEGGDVVIDGNIMAISDADGSGDYYNTFNNSGSSSSGYGGYSAADAKAHSEVKIRAGGDVKISGDVKVASYADGEDGYAYHYSYDGSSYSADSDTSAGDADAFAEVDIISKGNVSIDGDVEAEAMAVALGTNYSAIDLLPSDYGSSHVDFGDIANLDAEADIIIESQGDLTIGGNVTANAEGNYELGTLKNLESFLDDTSSEGDFEEDSDIDDTNFNAKAHIELSAGNFEVDPADIGDIVVGGNIEARANTSLEHSDDEYELGNADAHVILLAAKKITLDGADPLSQANAAFYQSRISGEDIVDYDHAMVILKVGGETTPPVSGPIPSGNPVFNPVPIVPPVEESLVIPPVEGELEVITNLPSLFDVDVISSLQDDGLGDLSPAAGGDVDGEFCLVVNVENSKICNTIGNSNI